MAKKKGFDLGSITEKLNISGVVDNVKSIISPTSITIDAKDGDEVGALLAHLNELVKEVAIEHEKQEQRLGQISKTSAQIYALLHQDDAANVDDAADADDVVEETAEAVVEEKAEPQQDESSSKEGDDTPAAEEDTTK